MWSKSSENGLIHDICLVQEPGKKFSPKTAFLDTLGEVCPKSISVTDRKYKRPFHPCLPAARRRRQRLLARDDGGGLSALSVARRSGSQYGVAWFRGNLDMRLSRA